MEKKKVLIVTEAVNYGGNNVVAMNLERHLDKSKFDFTYCVRREYIGAFENEIKSRGIRVIHVPDSQLDYLKSYKFYKNIFKNEHFDIVHCHLPFFSGIVLEAAKKYGVQKRVAHGHFSQPYTDTAIYSKPRQALAKIYRQAMREVLKYNCNVKLACSREAGEFLFGKKEFEKNGIILNNGIETEKFRFDENVRAQIRKELNIPENAAVLGHIGLMYSVKNQSFVIDVFNEYRKINDNSYLLLVGDGVDREMLEDKAKELNLSDRVIFTGERSDIERIYQALDCFVFPSIHEGFPLCLIEAQAAKLPCLVSENITKSTKLNSNLDFLSIDLPADTWAKKADELIKCDRKNIDISKLKAEFDIKNTAKELEKIYLS